MLVCRFITDHFAGYLSVSLRDHLISYLAGRLRELLTGQVAGHLDYRFKSYFACFFWYSFRCHLVGHQLWFTLSVTFLWVTLGVTHTLQCTLGQHVDILQTQWLLKIAAYGSTSRRWAIFDHTNQILPKKYPIFM